MFIFYFICKENCKNFIIYKSYIKKRRLVTIACGDSKVCWGPPFPNSYSNPSQLYYQ